MDNKNKCFYVSGEVTRFFLSGDKTIVVNDVEEIEDDQ